MRPICLFATTALALVSAAAASAQTAAVAATGPAGASSSSSLGEVVVTAQKRKENLQTVAIAATVIAGDKLKDSAVTRVDDLQYATPGLSVTNAGLTQNVNIRGIGLASGSPNAANGVATYIDGLFQPPIVTTNSFFDLASVEVLRGPQGTFVGSNSVGGAVMINSQNPSPTGGYHGYAEAYGQNYSGYGGQAAINLPVNDSLAFRVAGIFNRRDSYYQEPGGPSASERAGSLDEKGVRLGLLWKPIERFQILGKAELVDKDTGGYAYQPIPTTQFSAFGSSDPRTLFYDTPTRNTEHGRIYSLEMKYELPDGIQIRSISGYQDKQIWNLYDTDATSAAPQETQQQYVREREWTSELNIISPTTGRLSWITGGYFQHNFINVAIHQTKAGFPTDIAITTDKYTYGFFGQASYKLTSTIDIDAGLRYSGYKVSGTGGVVIGNGIPHFPPGGIQVANLAGGPHDDDAVTGKLAINWKPNSDNLVYAFVSRGYKAGGFNSLTSQFAPETVLDFEAGWKVTSFDGHVRTQLGGFYNHYTNFQADTLTASTGQTGISNVTGASHTEGFEAQTQAKLSGFTVNANLELMHSALGTLALVNQRILPGGTLGPQCPTPGVSNPPTCFDYVPYTVNIGGESLMYSPSVTFNVGVAYDFQLGNEMTLTPRINYAYQGSQWANLLENPVTDKLAAHGLWSAELTLKKGPISVQGYMNNIGNKLYVTGQSGNNQFYAAPREYGLRLHYDF